MKVARHLTFYDPPPSPPLEEMARDFPSNLVGQSLSTEWVEGSKKFIVEALSDAKVLATFAERLINAANDNLERSVDADLRKELALYGAETPLLTTWKRDHADLRTPLLIPNLQTLFVDQLGLKVPKQLIHPKTREDIDRIGTAEDFLAMIFWGEVQARYELLLPQTAEARYRYLAALGNDLERARLADISYALGAHIHSLRAKDITGRWAQYLSYVKPEREAEFLAKIGTQGDLDLNDYGAVIMSEYDDVFRERQMERVRAHFRPIVEDYTRLAVRERVYSIGGLLERARSSFTSSRLAGRDAEAHGPTQDRSEDAFKVRRFTSAVNEAGSADALVENLARHAVEQPAPVLVPPPPLPEAHLDVIFRRRLSSSSAGVMLDVFQTRGLDLSYLPAVASLITGPNKIAVEEFLVPLRNISRLLGRGELGFERFYLLVSHHRGLNHPLLLRAALGLANPSYDWQRLPIRAFISALAVLSSWNSKHKKGSGRTIAPSLAWRLGQNLPQLSDEQLFSVRQSMAALDFLVQIADAADELLATVRGYCVAEQDAEKEDGLQKILDIVGELSTKNTDEKIVVSGDDALRAGVRSEAANLAGLFDVIYTRDPKASDSNKYRLFLAAPSFILGLRSLSILGTFIESLQHSEKRRHLEALLREPVRQACEATGYPETELDGLVNQFVDALLRHDRAPDGSWVAKVTRQAKPAALLQRIALPKKAPAVWRDDKQPGDTPPAFIKRHYGAFLRADASGLTKPDIRQLDFSLYTALANWLRNNELPEDCPLPLKWQQVDAELQSAAENDVQDIDSKQLERLAKARQRRER